VGFSVDLLRAAHRLHPGQLDVGVDPVLLRGRGDNAAGRVAGEDYPVARITKTAKPAARAISVPPRFAESDCFIAISDRIVNYWY